MHRINKLTGTNITVSCISSSKLEVLNAVLSHFQVYHDFHDEVGLGRENAVVGRKLKKHVAGCLVVS